MTPNEIISTPLNSGTASPWSVQSVLSMTMNYKVHVLLNHPWPARGEAPRVIVHEIDSRSNSTTGLYNNSKRDAIRQSIRRRGDGDIQRRVFARSLAEQSFSRVGERYTMVIIQGIDPDDHVLEAEDVEATWCQRCQLGMCSSEFVCPPAAELGSTKSDDGSRDMQPSHPASSRKAWSAVARTRMVKLTIGRCWGWTSVNHVERGL